MYSYSERETKRKVLLAMVLHKKYFFTAYASYNNMENKTLKACILVTASILESWRYGLFLNKLHNETTNTT